MDSGHIRSRLSKGQRQVATRSSVKQALMLLLQKHAWRDVSVSALCRRAGVGRSSFYTHFKSKASVLDELFDDLRSEIATSAAQGDNLATLDWLAAHVGQNRRLFAKAVTMRDADSLFPRFRQQLIACLCEELRQRDIAAREGTAAFVIGGAMEYLRHHCQHLSTDELQLQLQTLAQGALRS